MGKPFQKENEPTCISSFYEGDIIIQNKEYNYTLWDTAGQEEYRSINKTIVKDSKIVFIVFAVNNKKFFEEVGYWINYVEQILEKDKYIMALVGNKSDDEQEISDEEIEKKAKELEIKVIITRALDDAIGFKHFLKELLNDFVKSVIGLEPKKPFSLKPPEIEEEEIIEEEKIIEEENNESENSNRRSSKKKKSSCCCLS